MLVDSRSHRLATLWSRTERWGLECLSIRYQFNPHFGDIALTQLVGPSLLMSIQYRSNVILFISRDVKGDLFSGYRLLVFTHV